MKFKVLRSFLVVSTLFAQEQSQSGLRLEAERAMVAQPERAQKAMVTSCNEFATQAGIEILKKGGNSVDAAVAVEEMRLPGLNFHRLLGFKPTRYTVHINGPWCITFEFANGDAHNVDFEQYH